MPDLMFRLLNGISVSIRQEIVIRIPSFNWVCFNISFVKIFIAFFLYFCFQQCGIMLALIWMILDQRWFLFRISTEYLGLQGNNTRIVEWSYCSFRPWTEENSSAVHHWKKFATVFIVLFFSFRRLRWKLMQSKNAKHCTWKLSSTNDCRRNEPSFLYRTTLVQLWFGWCKVTPTSTELTLQFQTAFQTMNFEKGVLKMEFKDCLIVK